MADKLKVRCSVCGDSVPIKNGCVSEHNYKYTGVKIVCYGSFLPVFQNGGNYQVGNVMYISRRLPSWNDDEPE